MSHDEFIRKADAAKDQAQLNFRKQRLNLRQYGCVLRSITAAVSKHETEPDKAEAKLAGILHKLTNSV